jgi:hypothetical protein
MAAPVTSEVSETQIPGSALQGTGVLNTNIEATRTPTTIDTVSETAMLIRNRRRIDPEG